MSTLIDRLTFRATATRTTAATLLTLLAAAGCAETEDALQSVLDSSVAYTQPDAYVPPTLGPTTGNPTIPDNTSPYSYPDASVELDATASYPDAAPRPDASVDGSNPFDFGSLFPSGTPDSSVAPSSGDAGASGWKLNADSAKECPQEPPPLPIIGGLCVGIYWMCGWTNAQGQKYSCTCDWIHYLCI